MKHLTEASRPNGMPFTPGNDQIPLTERVGKLADILYRHLLEAKASRTRYELVEGALLCCIAEYGLHRAYDCDTFEAFLAQEELSYSLRHAYRLMRVARVFVMPELGRMFPDGDVDAPERVYTMLGDVVERMATVMSVGIGKLDIIAAEVVASPDQRDALLAQAQASSVRDLSATLRERRRGRPDTEAEERLTRLQYRLHGIADKLAKPGEDPAKLLRHAIQVAQEALAWLAPAPAPAESEACDAE